MMVHRCGQVSCHRGYLSICFDSDWVKRVTSVAKTRDLSEWKVHVLVAGVCFEGIRRVLVDTLPDVLDQSLAWHVQTLVP